MNHDVHEVYVQDTNKYYALLYTFLILYEIWQNSYKRGKLGRQRKKLLKSYKGNLLGIEQKEEDEYETWKKKIDIYYEVAK